MRLHFLQHVPFENPGCIAPWARNRGHSLSGTMLFAGQRLPQQDAFDHLVVMGGPMGVHDDAAFAWMTTEKRFLEKTLASGKRTLGICLGAQLIAQVLGAEVYQNAEKEIGWFEVAETHPLTGEAESAAGSPRPDLGLPERFQAFHWHGDTFSLPAGALHLYQSTACRHQAFYHPPGILGLQFHLEITIAGISSLLDHCRHELVEGRFIQDAEKIRSQSEMVSRSNQRMFGLLDAFFDFQKN